MSIQPPRPNRALARAQAASAAYRDKRERLRTRSLVRGLLLVAVTIFVGSLLRAGVARAFVPNWWRPW